MLDLAYISHLSGLYSEAPLYTSLDDLWSIWMGYAAMYYPDAEDEELEEDDWHVYVRFEVDDDDYGVEMDIDGNVPSRWEVITIATVIDLNQEMYRYISGEVACDYMLATEDQWFVLYLKDVAYWDGNSHGEVLTHRVCLESDMDHPNGLQLLVCIKCPGWDVLLRDPDDWFGVLDWHPDLQEEIEQKMEALDLKGAWEMLAEDCHLSDGAYDMTSHLLDQLQEAEDCYTEVKKWGKSEQKRLKDLARKKAREWEDVLF